jgi:hypothetical protein
MKKLCCLIISSVIIIKGTVEGQMNKTGSQKYLFMKVITDDRTFKGRLYYVSDSAIRIIRGKNYEDLPATIAVQDIQQISFKRKNALIKSILAGIATGAVLGIGVLGRLQEYGASISDKAILYTSAAAAGAGLIIGALTAPVFKLIIPINRNQQLYEEKKLELKGFSIY